MEEKYLDKLIDMIKIDIWSFSISKEENDVKIELSFKYNKEKDCILYEKVTKSSDKKEVVTRGIISSKEDVLSVIAEASLISEAIQIVKNRIDKENRFKAVEVYMIEKIEEMNLTDEQKEIMMFVIKKTSQLNEYVGMGNRVYLVSTPDFWEHVRITDNSRWSDTGEELHLQLVQSMQDPEGVKHHNYPDLTFEAVVGRILDSLMVEKYKSSVEKVSSI